MCKALEEKYLSTHSKPELIEHFMSKELDSIFEIGGSLDFASLTVVLNSGTIQDNKRLMEILNG